MNSSLSLTFQAQTGRVHEPPGCRELCARHTVHPRAPAREASSLVENDSLRTSPLQEKNGLWVSCGDCVRVSGSVHEYWRNDFVTHRSFPYTNASPPPVSSCPGSARRHPSPKHRHPADDTSSNTHNVETGLSGRQRQRSRGRQPIRTLLCLLLLRPTPPSDARAAARDQELTAAISPPTQL